MSDKRDRGQEEDRDEGRQIRCEKDRKRGGGRKWSNKVERGQEEERVKKTGRDGGGRKFSDKEE